MVAAGLIAALASGQCKMTVAAKLMRMHARQVRCFKCGPHFLASMLLQATCGHAVNVPYLWVNGGDGCARRLRLAF